MKSSNKVSILVIGHEASLTGAPLLLLSYLRELKKNNSSFKFRIYLADAGPLLPQYLEIGDTFYDLVHFRCGPRFKIFLRIAAKSLSWLKRIDLRLAMWLANSPPPDLIYVNTIASIPFLGRITKHLPSGLPTVVHVHEMDWTLKRYEKHFKIGKELSKARHIIVPCSAVRDSLQRIFPIPTERISIINEWLCRPLVDPSIYGLSIRNHIRNTLGLSATDILCISVGQMQWRKGSDLLPQIAQKCLALNSSMHFVWIGHGSDDYLMQLHVENSRMGISSHCHFVGELQDPYPFYAAADIFLLPSREDPYPVVMIEAALFSLPIVCFDQTGGASDFVNEQLGVSVPYLDVNLFAKAAAELATNLALQKSKTNSSLRTIIDEHMPCNVEPKISELLSKSIV